MSREEKLRNWSEQLLKEDRKKILMDIRKDVHKIIFHKLEKYDWDKTKYFIIKRMEFFAETKNTMFNITYSEFRQVKEQMKEIDQNTNQDYGKQIRL